MKTKLAIIVALLAVALRAAALDPTATTYTPAQCQGTSMPYEFADLAARAYPDSLTPIFIDHVGRHGSRYLSSARYVRGVESTLLRADSLGTITEKGRGLLALCRDIEKITAGRWGALDSLGMAEQRALASRMYMTFKPLFDNTRIHAISTYVPRCVASMDEFTHQLTRMNNRVEIYTSSGRQNSALLRPWDGDIYYKEYIDGSEWREVYGGFITGTVPTAVAKSLLGEWYDMDAEGDRDFARSVYKVISGGAAFNFDTQWNRFLTAEQYNALWAVENLYHYLTHSTSTLSSSPSEMAAPLLKELMATLETASLGLNEYSVMLRFAHAETLMPLLSLLHIPGCYYMTNYFDTVGLHWRDWYIVPMAANLQLILFKADSGRIYLRADLNGVPVTLIPGRTDIYVPFDTALTYMNRCLPFEFQ